MSDAVWRVDLKCPWCRMRFRYSVGADGDENRPQDDDVSICSNCGRLAIVHAESDYGLRRPTQFEREELLADPVIVAEIEKWREYYKREPLPMIPRTKT